MTSRYVNTGEFMSRRQINIRDWCLNKAGYMATDVACGWAGAIFEVTRPFGQEQWGQRPQKPKKSKV